MENKVCTKCGEEKALCDFNKSSKSKDGYKSQCKLCVSISGKAYRENPIVKENNKRKQAEWVKNNDGRKEYFKSYQEKNADKIKEYSKEWHLKNKTTRNTNSLNYYYDNKEIINQKVKLKRQTDILTKIKHNISSLIRQSIKRQGLIKQTKTISILGCSYNDFREHLESKFEPWMTWDNYGLYNGTPNYGWDIDHVRPMNSAKTEDDIINLNHYTNLKPLCSHVNRNIKKGSY